MFWFDCPVFISAGVCSIGVCIPVFRSNWGVYNPAGNPTGVHNPVFTFELGNDFKLSLLPIGVFSISSFTYSFYNFGLGSPFFFFSDV